MPITVLLLPLIFLPFPLIVIGLAPALPVPSIIIILRPVDGVNGIKIVLEDEVLTLGTPDQAATYSDEPFGTNLDEIETYKLDVISEESVTQTQPDMVQSETEEPQTTPPSEPENMQIDVTREENLAVSSMSDSTIEQED